MTTGRLPSHHCCIALGLLTPHSILSNYELLIVASFLLLFSRRLINKNNNSKISRFENHALQNLHEIIL